MDGGASLTQAAGSRWPFNHVTLWAALVLGCALPLFLWMWPTSSGAERLAEVVGMVSWTGILARRPWAENMQRFARGAVVVLVAQAVAALAILVFSRLGLAVFFGVFYYPSLQIMLTLARDVLDSNPVIGQYLLTMICGGQVAVLAFLLGHLVTRRRPVMS
jgi:hypothetical protein